MSATLYIIQRSNIESQDSKLGTISRQPFLQCPVQPVSYRKSAWHVQSSKNFQNFL